MARQETFKSTIEDAVANAISDIEELKNEMEEWRDNMDSNNMSHLPKFEEVSETCDALDSILGNGEPTIPDDLAGVELEFFQYKPTRKGRGLSRSARATNTALILSGVASYITDDEKLDDKYSDLAEMLQEIADEVESVSFPGMF